MSDRKKCIRCGRAIDTWARLCPFCNHDQTEPVPAAAPTPAPVAEYIPPDDRSTIKRKLGIAGAGVLLLFVSFAVGTIINSDDTPKNAPEPILERPAGAPIALASKRADTQLIPMNEPIAKPITSAPPTQLDANVPNEYQRHDATAVSSVEYQQLAARAQAEKKAPPSFADPRSITGRAYAQAPRPRRTIAAAAEQSRVPSTRPVAEYQPVPNVNVHESTSVRLDLVIGPDGHVQDITMHGTVPRYTREVLAAVRRWRYKPATVNGVPVAAPVTVDISFNANE